jgi:hypothetical protein
MREIDAQLAEIERRRRALVHRRHRRETAGLGALCLALGASLGVSLAQAVPLAAQAGDAAELPAYYGTVLMQNPAVGFVLVVLLAFGLGVCATLLCLRIRTYREEQRKK